MQGRKKSQEISPPSPPSPTTKYHTFKEESVTGNWCNFCGDFIWPFTDGLQCTACTYNCHEECSKMALPCHVNAPFQPSEHTFVLTSFRRPTFCNLCRSILHGVIEQGLCCEVCKYIVHEDCSSRAPKCCRVSCVTDPQQEIVDYGHHWVEGNMRHKMLCSVCDKSVKSLILTNYRCAWCKHAVHSTCLARFHKRCGFGGHCNIIIPPYAIVKPDGATPNHELLGCHLPSKPLVVFINPKSGGQQGNKILRKLRYILNPLQVFTLVPGGPGSGVAMIQSFFQSNPQFKPREGQNVDLRVVVCGGDGTAGWILQSMAELGLVAPVGIIPLGTGNDLARTLGWGPGYEGEHMCKILLSLENATIRSLDRWNVLIAPYESDQPIFKVMTNYFSIGVDAKVALGFHLQREANPDLFKNRFVNKLWYTKFGAEAVFNGCENLNKEVTVELDGNRLFMPPLEGVVVVNLPSYAAGLNLWASGDPLPGTKPQAIDDNLLELEGLSGSGHMGTIQTGLSSGVKLGQGQAVRIYFRKESMPIQVDGEPWMQPPSCITITLRDKVPMLICVKDQ